MKFEMSLLMKKDSCFKSPWEATGYGYERYYYYIWLTGNKIQLHIKLTSAEEKQSCFVQRLLAKGWETQKDIVKDNVRCMGSTLG